jgi:hypothetical protein
MPEPFSSGQTSPCRSVIVSGDDITEPSPEIIAEPSERSLAVWLGGLAACWGVAVAIVYFQAGLTLSHYDAKGHLVVARRILDSLTPGWLQVGAVWLPLPHLLNVLPVQVDALYRTGASGVAISVASFALLVYASARFTLAATSSAVAAVTTALLIASNPNLLYLQSTPMTEPLLLGLVALGLTLTFEGLHEGGDRLTRAGFVVLALACLTRYEAWPITGAAVAAVVLAGWRAGASWLDSLRRAARLALIPAVGILWFFVHSKATVGAWFVTDGFYVRDPMYQAKPLAALGAVWWGTRQLGSEALAHAAAISAIALLIVWWRRPRAWALIVALAWIGACALAWYAFYAGHPLRIRYMVPAVAAAGALTGVALGMLPRRWQVPVAIVLLLSVWAEARPFDAHAAMVLEAQWDRPRSIARRAVTTCLPPPGQGEVIMASMGSLAHYMQELASSGYSLNDFLHEGNGDLWLGALNGPERYVRWILIEEVAEGGDMLAERERSDPRFLAGFTRICSGGGVSLYKNSAKWEVRSAK